MKFNSVTAGHATEGKPLSKFQLSPGPERVQTYWGMTLHRSLPGNLRIDSTLPVLIFLITFSPLFIFLPSLSSVHYFFPSSVHSFALPFFLLSYVHHTKITRDNQTHDSHSVTKLTSQELLDSWQTPIYFCSLRNIQKGSGVLAVRFQKENGDFFPGGKVARA